MIRAGRGHFTPELVPPVPYSHAICTSCCVSSREGTICIRSCTQHLQSSLPTAPAPRLPHSTSSQACPQHLQPGLHTAPPAKLAHSTCTQACTQHLQPGFHPRVALSTTDLTNPQTYVLPCLPPILRVKRRRFRRCLIQTHVHPLPPSRFDTARGYARVYGHTTTAMHDSVHTHPSLLGVGTVVRLQKRCVVIGQINDHGRAKQTSAPGR